MNDTTKTCKGLILDFGGVISRTLFETHAQTERILELKAGSLDWFGPFDPSNDPLWQSMQRDEITERDYWLTRSRGVGTMLGENWSTMAEFVQRARGNGDYKDFIRPEALNAVSRIKTAKIKIAVLSNELDLFYGADFRQTLPFLENFDVIEDATYSQILKPAAAAYENCAEKLGLKPQECVFVDDQKRNIEGANAVGMETVLFDVHNPAKSYDQALALFGL